MPTAVIDGPPCGICNSRETDILIPCAPDYITQEDFVVHRCRSCDSCFTVPSPPHLDPYYPSTYRAYGPITESVLHSIYRLRVRRWNRMFDGPGRVLEVGCGSGIMLKAFRDAGWMTTGTERNADAAEAGRKHGLNICSASIEDLPEDGAFDLILLFQVFEHMQDPVSVLENCRRLLKDRGLVVIGVPNIASWQARIGRADWLHLDVPRHLFHFSPRSLSCLLERSGFTPVGTGFTSWEHDPFGWVQTFENKLFPKRNALLRYLSGFDRLDWQNGLAALFGAILVPIAILLALVSWLFEAGALQVAIASKRRDLTISGE